MGIRIMAMNAKPPALCGGALRYEGIAGMRVYREVSGRNVYEARCSVCHMTSGTDGNAKTCTVKARVQKRGASTK